MTTAAGVSEMRWRRWIDSLLHPALLADVAWKPRFLVECLALGVAMSVAFGTTYLLRGAALEGAITFVGAAGLGGCIVSLRWARTYEPVAWAAMFLCLTAFATPALVEPALDPAVLAWAALVPYAAALLLSVRQAVIWAALSLAMVVVVVVLRAGQPVVAPDPLLSTARVLGLVVTVFVFGVRFAREQAQALGRLDSANRAKSAFLATMSHEIRTPMNGVLGLTEVLLSGPLDVETREKLALVRESGHTLIKLVNDILDFSKIEAGKLEMEQVDFELRSLVDDVAGLHRPAAEAKGVGLVVSVDPSVPLVARGDGLRLRQVLTNLVSNAVKFTERGEVRVLVEAAGGDQVRFVVADSGIGIAPGAATRLFAPFEQGDGSTTRRFGGSGLGLALSQSLVRMMGGLIQVESVLGVGSRFSFEVRLERGLRALSPRAQEPGPPERRSSLPVLVVDDNRINLKVACSLLERVGYKTETAENGEQALQLVASRPYVLVLMDCHMPVMDGLEATRRIRALEGDVAMTPVVALTASAMPEELEACKRAGMNDCLTKPVSLQALKAVLQRIEHYRGIFEGAA